MYGTSIEKAASSSISLWANLSHGRGWDVGGTTMWWGWGLKGEGWWVSQWEQQLHFLSPHCDALDPPNQQSATVLYHALNSISIILPTLPWYITLLHIIIQSPIQPAKTPGAGNAVDVNIRGGESDAYLMDNGLKSSDCMICFCLMWFGLVL